MIIKGIKLAQIMATISKPGRSKYNFTVWQTKQNKKMEENQHLSYL